VQRAQVLRFVEAACDPYATTHEALRAIARAAECTIPRGPVAVVDLCGDGPCEPEAVRFERAEPSFVSRFLEWHRELPLSFRRLALALAPGAIRVSHEVYRQLPVESEAAARGLFRLCIVANTGDGNGLHIAFGDPELDAWRPSQLQQLDEIAAHLGAAWRIRTILNAAASRASTTPGSQAALTPRAVLQRAILAHERARTGQRSPDHRRLWTALLAGRWSVFDSFLAGGARYVVAYENPSSATPLRALASRERDVLELVVAGRSGKWIATELALSESVVARTLRGALRNIGVSDTAALAGVRTAWFEPLDELSPRSGLAMARLAPGLSRASRARLSDAEQAIVAAILGGKRIAAIARERGTSPRTVAHQITSMYQKLGVSSRRELLALLT
jgi:DNA-binding NarL/FixJ family response regulator